MSPITKCAGHSQGKCTYYRWPSGLPLRCNGIHAACFGRMDHIVEIKPLTRGAPQGKAIFTSESREPQGDQPKLPAPKNGAL